MGQSIKRYECRRLTLLVFIMLMCIPHAFAQQKFKVSGRIVDQKTQDPLIGVSIMEKGTSNGIMSDINGHYALTVNKGATLVFTYVGYLTVQKVANTPTLNITLSEDTKTLDEVVVVGYGVQKRSSLTGSVSQVKSEDMVARTITTAGQALQGKTAGVEVLSASARPGSSPTIRIRGISSNGSSDPLFVVDGRISSDISGIDPNDIESMEVLKDAASAAIYGSRAGNGVVLITTKKGKGNGKITYDFQLTSQSLSKVPKVMNSEQYIDYYIDAGKLTETGVYKYWDGKTNTDWTKVAFESSIMQRHNLTFQSGGDKGSLYTSLTYLDNNGMVVGNNDIYKRFTGMVNADYNIKPWLELGTNNQIEYYKMRTVSEGSEYNSLLLSVLQLDPLTKATYTVNDMPDNMKTILNGGSAYATLLSDGKGNYYGVSPFATNENLNPLIMRDRSFSDNRGFNINGSTFLNFKPIKGLVVTSRLGYLLSATETYGYSNDYWANTISHQKFMSVNAATTTPTYFQWENFANYTFSLGKHTITAMLGTHYSETRSFSLNGSITGSDTDLGVKRDDPLFYYFAYATSSATKALSGGEPIYTRNLSYFGRLNYNFENKYLAQFSLRADAADNSVLPIDKRWGYFPAFSLGWVLSEEKFMKSTNDWLSTLKLRLSWGQNGSTASLGNYLYDNVISSTGSYPFGNSLNYNYGYLPSSTGNDQLKWETSEQTDFGFDSYFLNNRLSLSFDYYTKKTKDLIVTGITPSTIVGNTASPVNAGDITNKGVEIELGWQDHISDFRYSIRGNIATLKNKVTYLHKTLDAIDGTTFHTYGAITRFKKGQPAWYFYGYKFTGIDQKTGDPTFEDTYKDGTITDKDKTYIGKGIPDFTYGITLTAAWKGLDFIVFGTGSKGNDIYSCLDRADYMVNKLTEFTADRWTSSHTNGTRPRAGANDMSKYFTSSASVYDGSYFKIKQIQLGYSLPTSLLKKICISNLRIYGSLEDFFTFTKYKGFDPEVTGVGSALGVDKGSYPTSKKVVCGISITF
ncbi:MAG: TonB-dependent receptor [Bacteroidales bacterium]|nr:TonB-dependent receptor [Bacteroidales bacterium]